MPIDSNGIWTFEETDAGATMSDLLNLAQDTTSARVAALQAAVEAREPLLGDTDWVNVLTNPQFAPHPSFPPQVRQIGGRVAMRGGWSGTGIVSGAANSVGYVPQGFWPPIRSGSSGSAFGQFWAPAVAQMGAVRVFTDGLVELRTSTASVPSSLLVMDGMGWYVD